MIDQADIRRRWVVQLPRFSSFVGMDAAGLLVKSVKALGSLAFMSLGRRFDDSAKILDILKVSMLTSYSPFRLLVSRY